MNILPGEKFIFPRFLLSLSALLMMALITQGCSDNGSDITLTNELGGGWVTIATPSDSGSATTYCDSAWVSGEAFISADYFRCCSGSATDTGVTVSWENLVTGTHGDASQAVDYCYLFGTPYLCNHTWQAEIPLILGDNIIQISAIDPGGAGGRDTITIYKPEYGYNLSGRVSTYDDLGLGYFQSGVELTLTGGVTTRAIPSSADGYGMVTGEYQFSCIPNGAYTLAVSAPSFNYIFDPALIDLTVAGQDVFNLDFQTTAYPLSGSITDSNGVAKSSFISVAIASGGGSWSWPVQTDGSYTYFVPNGSYTITPSDYFCLSCYFTPPSRAVEVTDLGVSGMDFVWNP